MIYFLYGDSNKIFVKSNDLINTIIKKNPEATFFKIDSENFDDFNINEMISGRSLFTGKQIIYFKRVFENSTISDFLLKRIKDIANSKNIFIVAEEKLSKPIFNKIEKNSEKVQNFEKKEKILKKENNIFDMANALGNRDTKKLWIMYQEKIKTVRPEEIHGIFWWQIKSILSAIKSNSAHDSGLKPFVFQKAKTYANKYSEKELNKISNDLIHIVHESRRSGPSLELSLERFILSI